MKVISQIIVNPEIEIGRIKIIRESTLSNADNDNEDRSYNECIESEAQFSF